MFNHDFPLATMQAMIDGVAYRPFQFRILIPWMVGMVNSLTGVLAPVIYQIVEALAVGGLIIATRYFLASFFRGKILDLLAIGLLLVLPWNYLLPQEYPLFIPADIPAAMFFTLLLALMLRAEWRWYYLLFALATINRETTCFVSLIFLLTQWKRLPLNKLLTHLGAQLAIWVSIKTALWLIYADNPGVLFEIYGVLGERTHLAGNLEFLADPGRIPVLLSCFGYLWIVALFWRKRIGSEFIRRALLGLPVFFVVMLFIGNLNETRIFGEFAPLVYVAGVLIIKSFLSDTKNLEKQTS